MADLIKTVFSLTKNNGGKFKSEAQAKFIIDYLKKNQNFIGQADSGYNTAPLFAEADAEGITKVIKHTFSGGKGYKDEVVWERGTPGVLSPKREKEIKNYDNATKKLEKALADRKKSWDAGTYDTNNKDYKNDPDAVERYKEVIAKKEDEINRRKEYSSKMKRGEI